MAVTVKYPSRQQIRNGGKQYEKNIGFIDCGYDAVLLRGL